MDSGLTLQRLVCLLLAGAVVLAHLVVAAQHQQQHIASIDENDQQYNARLLCADSSKFFCDNYATGTECVRNHTVSLELCKATCRTCKALAQQVEQDTRFVVAVVHTPEELTCQDLGTDCAALKGQGLCNDDRHRMLQSCPATCGFCRASSGPADTYHACRDSLDVCPYWATTGLCDAPMEWPRYLCAASCGRCPPAATLQPLSTLTSLATGQECVDYNPHCPKLADQQHCTTAYEFMALHCPATCGFCRPGSPDPNASPAAAAATDAAGSIGAAAGGTWAGGAAAIGGGAGWRVAGGKRGGRMAGGRWVGKAGSQWGGRVNGQGAAVAGWQRQGAAAGAAEEWVRGADGVFRRADPGAQGAAGQEAAGGFDYREWMRDPREGQWAAGGSRRWAVPPTGPACDDLDGRCEGWAGAGGCEMSAAVRGETCRVACGQCEPLKVELQLLRRACEDGSEFCSSWAKDGQCAANPDYMLKSCGVACGVCDVAWTQWVRPVVRLNNGVLMPVLGFGTAGLGEQTDQAVADALQLGYRLIDTAQAREWYREDLVGLAIRRSGLPREALFLTTKLHPRHLGYMSTLTQVQASLTRLGSSYLDLFLLHYPECWGTLCSPQRGGTWQDSWRALEQLYADGRLRALGVSNFNLDQMQQLVAIAKVKPAVLQFNSDPLRPAFALQSFCRKHGIHFQAYSSLGTQWGSEGPNPVLTGAPVLAAARRYNASAPQVVLRWALQHGQLVIPRSQNVRHMAENLGALFSLQLDRETMVAIDDMEVQEP